MAAIAWPGSLPQSMEIGMVDIRQTTRTRFDTDVGPPKQRARFSAAVRTISGTMILTDTQRSTFETFYVTTSDEGVNEFDFVDPLDGSTQDFRFVEAPTFEALVGGSSGAALWRVRMVLERLP